MDLLLWRHAEAEDGFPDQERRLTPRGEKEARQMATWLKAHAPQPLSIIVSPAVRCQQTAGALGLPFATSAQLSTDADAADLLAAAGWTGTGGQDAVQAGKHASDEGRRAVLVVGHQPTLGRVAALLLGGRESEWSVKKGAVWWLSRRVRQGEAQTVLRAVVAPEHIS